MSASQNSSKMITRAGYTLAARLASFYINKGWRHSGTASLDRPWYRSFCARAAEEKTAFSKFRSDFRYGLFVENNNEDEGRYYLETALAGCPHYAQFLDRFRTGDRFGGARKFSYGKRGLFAPTTLRYVKYLSDCERLFGSFDSRVVAEIGVGYGGLAKIFFDRFDLERYVLIDLPETLALTRRYLTTALGPDTVQSKLEFVNALDPKELAAKLKPQYFDLALSIRGFSSCRRDVQKKYLEYVLNTSNNGYMVTDSLAGAFGISRHRDEEVLLLLQKDVSIESDPASWWDDSARIWTWFG